MTYDTYPVPRAALEAQIVTRARSDAAFLAALFDEPRRAISEALGCDLPERLSVHVAQETPECLCVVLPVDLSGMSARAVGALIGRPVTGAAVAHSSAVEPASERRGSA